MKQIVHAFSTSTIRRHCSFFMCVGAGAGALATAVHLQAMLLPIRLVFGSSSHVLYLNVKAGPVCTCIIMKKLFNFMQSF